MDTNEISNGSLRQLWKVSSALMISFLSMVTMMFVDRLFLSYYSADALSAATSAGTLFWASSFMCVTFAAMGEVFVAQYNGSKQFEKLGTPVWQMIYFSAISFFFFMFLGSYGSDFFMKINLMNSSEVEYFRWNNYFAPWLTLLTAISAFFIGQGKTSIIKWMSVLGNGINILLDPLFIFGYKGIVPSMGIKGAAIATGIGIIVQVIVIGSIFLKKENQASFGTSNFRFNKSLFLKCLRVGTPPALFVLFELLGWATFYMMMERISSKHILVASVTQSILLLFLFFGLGLEKGAAAIAGNLIGAKKLGEIKRLFWSGIKLSLIFGAFLAVFLGGFAENFIDLFFKNSEALSGSAMGISTEMLSEIKTTLKFSMIVLVLYLTLENVRWLLSGLLTAAGDTFFPMALGLISIWLFMLAPTYFFVVIPKAPIERALFIWVLYSAAASALFLIRFARGKWKEKKLISIDEGETSSVPSQNPAGEMGN